MQDVGCSEAIEDAIGNQYTNPSSRYIPRGRSRLVNYNLDLYVDFGFYISQSRTTYRPISTPFTPFQSQELPS